MTASLALLWLLAIAAGFGALADYGSTPGDPGDPVTHWPAAAPLERDGEHTELLLFAHALCPCTRASLAELERVLARVPSPPHVRVVLWTDPDQPERFARSVLRDRVLAVPALELVEDPGGELARAFGCRTSGTALLFDPRGALRFAGGLTLGRGHEGLALGGEALTSLLRGETPPADVAPVFGCPLQDDAEAARA